jgi:hypothetical protein
MPALLRSRDRMIVNTPHRHDIVTIDINKNTAHGGAVSAIAALGPG